MDIDLSGLEILVPETPTRTDMDKGSKLDVYDVQASLYGEIISEIQIKRIQTPVSNSLSTPIDPFWYYGSCPPQAIPVVVRQKTDEDYQRNGLATTLIENANNVYRKMFGVPVYSDTSFLFAGVNPNLRLGMRTWQKLERKGLAEEIEYRGERRWKMVD